MRFFISDSDGVITVFDSDEESTCTELIMKSDGIVVSENVQLSLRNDRSNKEDSGNVSGIRSNQAVYRQTETLVNENEQDGANERINALPMPKVVLYSREKVVVGTDCKVGRGMLNVGNTCYLNSTLQALFHIPAFANWLLSDGKHRKICGKTG